MEAPWFEEGFVLDVHPNKAKPQKKINYLPQYLACLPFCTQSVIGVLVYLIYSCIWLYLCRGLARLQRVRYKVTCYYGTASGAHVKGELPFRKSGRRTAVSVTRATGSPQCCRRSHKKYFILLLQKYYLENADTQLTAMWNEREQNEWTRLYRGIFSCR